MRRLSVGDQNGYDTRDFVKFLRQLEATSHATRRMKIRTLDGRIARHTATELSQLARKRIEEVFSQMKTIVGLRQPASSWRTCV